MNFPQTVRALIFDLDGTMLDSEPIHYESLVRQFDRYGVRYTEAQHDALVGQTDLAVYATIRREQPGLLPGDDVLVPERAPIFLELTDRPLTPLPGVVDLLRAASRLGLRIGCASASPLPQIEVCLRNLGLRPFFETVRSGESVPRSKPWPDVYLAAARDLDVDPSDCVALEDSSPGLRAASSAGIFTVVIPRGGSEAHDLSAAGLRLRSLVEFPLDALERAARRA